MLGRRYRLSGRIGRGGMAEVFEGHDDRLARPVAVKVLHPELSVYAGVRRRFESEARTAGRLTHPNIVTIYDTGEDNGQAYIVMELVPGESLADRLRRGPLDEGSVRAIAADVLAGLGAAHAAGIVHRDVKPANILLTTDGRAKVSDFGIAKSVQPAGTAGDLETASGQLVGTAGYVAPERLNGQPATPQSDLYSLGVVLYEALVGRKPFEQAVAEPTVAHRPRAAGSGRLWMPPATERPLAAAIRGALRDDPRARYRTSEEMLDTLRGRLGEPTRMLPPDGTRLSRPSRTRRWRGALMAAAVLGIAGALFLVAYHHPSSRNRTATTTTVTTSAATRPPASAVPPPATTAVPPLVDPAAASLRQLANGLSVADGSAAPDLAAALDHLAGLPPAARTAAATGVLSQAAAWERSGLLSPTAYGEALPVLASVGATVPQPPSSPPAPTPAKHDHKPSKG